MPNDMSPIPVPDPTTALADRTQRYCTRAYALADDASLTQMDAARALTHLKALQDDIRTTRLQHSAPFRSRRRQAEAPFISLEDQLKDARAALSEALLRATPDPACTFGSVPHGTRHDLPTPDESGQSAEPPFPPAPQAVSASRALLDLDALRPYLSEAALRDALDRYTKKTGHHDVAGVAYASLPPSAHLRCAIY